MAWFDMLIPADHTSCRQVSLQVEKNADIALMRNSILSWTALPCMNN